MELKIWAKSFFSIYRCLNKLASSIDKYVQIKALSSYQTSFSSLSYYDTERITQDITELMNKKINLINIKVLTEKVLKILPTKFARFVILKYMEDKTFDEIAFSLDISMRTALRWNNQIMEKSGKILESLGYSNEKLLNLIGNESWIKRISNILLTEDSMKRQPKLSYYYIMRLAEKEYKTLAY